MCKPYLMCNPYIYNRMCNPYLSVWSEANWFKQIWLIMLIPGFSNFMNNKHKSTCK